MSNITFEQPSFHDFRSRLLKREQLLGTFIKMPTTQAIEILATVGFDFVIIDQEHAPLGREITDMMVLGARASNLAAIVRVGEIARVEGIDALFIGRGDLSAALGSPSPTSPETTRVVERIAEQARDVGCPLLVLASNKADALNMRKLGASSFMLGSDHGFIMAAASAAVKELALPLALRLNARRPTPLVEPRAILRHLRALS